MIRAYDEIYLAQARTSIARMLDYAVHDLGYTLDEFWKLFVESEVCRRFEYGESRVLAGMSGVEIAREVVSTSIEPNFTITRSREYWTGWAVAYFQWATALSFEEITSVIPIEEIRDMYSPFHEMDITQFYDRMCEIYAERVEDSNLKRIRLRAGLSQSELSRMSKVPVRTIQQYEQRQKNINKANAEYVITLAHVLCCEPIDLMEKVDIVSLT